MKIDNKTIIIGYEERTNDNQVADKKWYINQCGYDVDKSKRATFTNGVRGCTFYLKDSTTDEVVFTGIIYNQIADFTKFNTAGEYYLECNGVKSYTFKIADNRILDVSLPNALKFMEMSRQDAFDVGGNTGYAWRDSHQFSFELNSLVMMYMANPSYYDNLPHDVYKVDKCEYTELQTQNEPNIIWLIKYGVTRYYDWCTNKGVTLHALIKGQLAYFLYLYPYIANYVTQEFYEQIRDFAITQWSVASCNKTWYDSSSYYLTGSSINHNLFTTQNVIGNIKGCVPPGYAIVPNLMMYEVLKRDGIDGYQNYLDSAINNLNWLLSLDLTNSKYTKGQRMNEYIVIHNITYIYEMYPNLCPSNTYEIILNIAKVFISRSNNIWDYRQYRTEGDLTNSTSNLWVNEETSGGLCNQPGNVAGFLGVCLMLARVIDDEIIVKKLKQIGISHIDHVYGRNPLGRHFCYTATSEFDGAKLGWIERYQGGFGNLGYCIGVLDGSPKNENYIYNPSGSTGYTEGWVAFNTAWNMSLAYLCGEDKNITDGIGIFAKTN